MHGGSDDNLQSLPVLFIPLPSLLTPRMPVARDIAVFVGSLRKEAITRRVALTLAEVAPASLELDIVTIGDLPL